MVAPMRWPTLRRMISAICAGALAFATSVVMVGQTPAYAATCGSSVPGDINGDGHGDLAIGEPGNHTYAGSVHVLYGTATGLVTNRTGTALNDQYFTQDTPGVPGVAEPNGDFGSSVSLADVNGDRCADLIVSATGYEIDPKTLQQSSTTSTITVLYGSPAGIATAGAQVIDSTTFPSPMHRLRLSTVADVNQDGIGDLVTKALSTRHGDPRVGVVYGSRAGLNRGALKAEVLNNAGLGLSTVRGRTGAIVAGDFDGDGSTELAIGQLVQDQEGYAAIVRRTPTGWVGGAKLTITSPGVPKAPEKYGDFGETLAAGDFDADGDDDLAAGISAPLCDHVCREEDREDDAMPSPADGAVVVYRGSRTGLSGTRAQLWTQDSPGVIGSSIDEGFGTSLAVGHLDTGPTDDLVIGAPREEISGQLLAGSVTVLLGSPSGLTTAGRGGASFTQATSGIAGSPERWDGFGEAVQTVAVRQGTQSLVIIGSPSESIGKVRFAGQVHQLAYTAAGPTGTGSRSFSANTAGLQGKVGEPDYFGASLG